MGTNFGAPMDNFGVPKLAPHRLKLEQYFVAVLWISSVKKALVVLALDEKQVSSASFFSLKSCLSLKCNLGSFLEEDLKSQIGCLYIFQRFVCSIL